jgi:RNase H-like domain found in reverse transcriptase
LEKSSRELQDGVSGRVAGISTKERSVELGINVEEGTEPLSKPAYRLSPAELDELKIQLTLLLYYITAFVLKIADPALDYVVTTDANDVAIGAVLEQEYEDGLHSVAYAFRKLNSAEQNYPTHDRELLAIIYAVREWRTYLHGARFRFAVITTCFSTWKPNP